MRAVYANCKLALSERPRSEDPYSKNPVFAACLASAGSQSEREREISRQNRPALGGCSTLEST